MHHYLLTIPQLPVTLISEIKTLTQTTQMIQTFLMHQNNISVHSQSKHKYRNTFGESNIQYHDFDNKDALTFTDKYMALSQQELQNPYFLFT